MEGTEFLTRCSFLNVFIIMKTSMNTRGYFNQDFIQCHYSDSNNTEVHRSREALPQICGKLISGEHISLGLLLVFL